MEGRDELLEALAGDTPIVHINIAGVDVPFLVDSGSQVTTITSEFFEEHLRPLVGHDAARPLTFLNVHAANGGGVAYDGYVIADFTVANTTVKRRGMLLVPEPVGRRAPGVLGTNVMRYLPEYQKYIASISGHSVDAETKKDRDHTFGLVRTSGSSEICIPAESYKWVKVYSRRDVSSCGMGVIEPARQLFPGLTLAPAVMREKNCYIPICNHRKEDVFLKPNVPVGLLRPVTEVLSTEFEITVDGDELVVKPKAVISTTDTGIGSQPQEDVSQSQSPADTAETSPTVSATESPAERSEPAVVVTETASTASKPEVPDRDKPPNTEAEETVVPDLLDVEFDRLVSEFPGSEEEKVRYRQILSRNRPAFVSSPTDVGYTTLVEHHIPLTDDKPVIAAYRRIAPALLEEVRQHLDDLLNKGFIRVSKSNYASPIVIVRKKSGQIRLCCDYRALNAKSLRDAHCLPRIQESLDSLAGAEWFICLDLSAAYNQVPIKPEDQHKTAFTTPFGLYEWVRMSFGLMNSPATFQRLMNELFRKELFQLMLCYLDDILIHGKSLSELLDRLDIVLSRLSENGLKLELSKCSFFKREVTYLGHQISSEGIKVDPAKMSVVEKWTVPQTLKELRSYLGFCSYLRRFVPNFTSRAKPLQQLVTELCTRHPKRRGKTPSVPIGKAWTADHQRSFEDLKIALTTAPVLGYPRYDLPYILETDAAETGLGAVISQIQDGRKRIIAYASRGLRKGESNKANYSSKKLELLALKWAVTDKFREYLLGSRFVVYTDNNPLTYLFKTKKLSSLEHRWANALAPFNFEFKFRSGSTNIQADILSRLNHHQDKDMSSDEIDSCLDDAAAATTLPAELRYRLSQDAMEVVDELAEKEDTVIKPPTPEDVAATTIPTITKNHMAELQREDVSINRLKYHLKQNKRPKGEAWRAESSEVRKYLKHWSRYVMKDDVVYRRIQDPHGNEVNQLVLPESLRHSVLESLHDHTGHQGQERTEALLRARCFWPTLQQDVASWIDGCDRCKVSKMPYHRIKTPMGRLVATRPGEVVAMDFTTLEKASNGKENVLVITDVFTKFTIAVPTTNQQADTVARVLVHEWFFRYGIPLRLHSDNGRSFEGEVIKALCKIYKIKKSSTTPYHPIGNGQCERYNRSLHELLRPMVAEKKRKWPLYLPELVQAYNSTPHSSTGYSPFYLMFGRTCRLPVDTILGTAADDDANVAASRDDWVALHQSRLQAAYEIAERQINHNADRRKAIADQKTRHDILCPGQCVYIRKRVKGRNKIGDSWSSRIYKIISRQGDNHNYVIEPADGFGERKTVNRAELRPCNYHDWDIPEHTVDTVERRLTRRVVPPCPPTRQNSSSRESTSSGRYVVAIDGDSGRYNHNVMREILTRTDSESSSSSESATPLNSNSSSGDETVVVEPRFPRRSNRGQNPNPNNLPRSAVHHLYKKSSRDY